MARGLTYPQSAVIQAIVFGISGSAAASNAVVQPIEIPESTNGTPGKRSSAQRHQSTVS